MEPLVKPLTSEASECNRSNGVGRLIVALESVVPVVTIPEILSGSTSETVVALEVPFSVPVIVTVSSAPKALVAPKNTPLARPGRDGQ